MVQEYVDKFMSGKKEIRAAISKHPDDYEELFRKVFGIIVGDGYEEIDLSKLSCVDYGDYHGSLLFVAPCTGYQPDTFYVLVVDYGSCPGCDTLCAIHSGWDEDEAPTEKELDDYMSLALHMVQGLKKLSSD